MATVSISVCIPTLGRPSLSSTALPSVLGQIGSDDEVVVVFDRVPPIDDAILAHPQVTVVEHDGGSVGSARNAAVAAARGDVVVFLDDDDALAEGAVDAYRSMLRDARVAMAFGSAHIAASATEPERLHRPSNLGGLYCGIDGTFLAGTFAVRRPLLDQVGGYHEELRFGENYDLGIRLAKVVTDEELECVASDQVMVLCAPSGNPYREARAHAARFTLDTYPDLLAGLPEQRATLHAILGVHGWRVGERSAARVDFRAAAAARPFDVRHLGRLVISMVRPLGDRMWMR